MDPGFEIYGTTYPLISLPDWQNQDFVLARQLTLVPVEKLVGDKGDRVLLQQALVAVAMWHGQPERSLDEIIAVVSKLKPSEISEVGFDEPAEDGGALPPGAAKSSGSSDDSETVTDAIQET